MLFSLPGLENPWKSYEKYFKTSYLVCDGYKPRALRCIKYTIQYNLFFQSSCKGKTKQNTPDNSGLRAENSLLIVGEEINIHFLRTEGLPFQQRGRIDRCEVKMAATKYICSKINFKKKVKSYVTNRLNGWDSESTMKKTNKL